MDLLPQQVEQVSILLCQDCGGPRQQREVKQGLSRCRECTCRRQVGLLLDERRITQEFATTWAARLLRGLDTFLGVLEVSWRSRIQTLRRAQHLLQQMEEQYPTLDAVDPAWAYETMKHVGSSRHWSLSITRAYLRKEGLAAPAHHGDQERIQRLLARVVSLPEGYQRAVEVYLNERLAQREWQSQHQAKHILDLSTLEDNWRLLSHMVHWLTKYVPEVPGWNMVQEEHVQAYLLTFTPVRRETTRVKLYAFFRAARRRHTMAHVPLTYSPARDFSTPGVPAVDLVHQRALARHIRADGATWPTEALLTVLCFYHALTVRDLREIRLADIDQEHATIRIDGRPPVYLSDEDLALLQGHLQRRATAPFAKLRTYLFVPHRHVFVDVPLSWKYIKQRITAFSGHLPHHLRTACLVATATRYGPQHLVEAFGVSLTHASRFGSLHDALIEEAVRDQRESYKRVAHQVCREVE
jgi:hypothetical protein